MPKFWWIPLPGSLRIPYPVNVSGIPHCILVKSRIPGKPFQILLSLKRPCYVKTCHRVSTKYPWRAFFLGPPSGDWTAISTWLSEPRERLVGSVFSLNYFKTMRERTRDLPLCRRALFQPSQHCRSCHTHSEHTAHALLISSIMQWVPIGFFGLRDYFYLKPRFEILKQNGGEIWDWTHARDAGNTHRDYESLVWLRSLSTQTIAFTN